MHYNVALLTLSSLIPFAASTYVKSGSSSCKNTEFWWKDKQCCLPHGGIPSPPAPPKGSYCPPTGYYWNNKQGCCVPHHPPPDHGPEPQCPKDCKWYPALYKCLPIPKPTPTYTPKPSATPTPKPTPKPTEPCPYGKGKYGDGKCDNGDGHDHDGHDHDGKDHDGKDYDGKDGKGYGNNNGKGNGGYGKGWRRKRSVHKYRINPCPTGLEACPISGLTGDYECLDTLLELESCGGCASAGKGQDCTAIKGAWNVGCEEGRCVVYTCAAGFQPSYDRQSCLPL